MNSIASSEKGTSLETPSVVFQDEQTNLWFFHDQGKGKIVAITAAIGCAIFTVGAFAVGLKIEEHHQNKAVLGGCAFSASVLALVSIYLFAKRYYKDPKARADYRKELEAHMNEGTKALDAFIRKHGWNKISTYGFAQSHEPIATRELMGSIFLREPFHIATHLNYKHISFNSRDKYVGVSGRLWDYLDNGMFTNEQIQKLRQHFKNEFFEFSASDLYENFHPLKTRGFFQDPELAIYVEWLSGNRQEYVSQVANFEKQRDTLLELKRSKIRSAQAMADNKKLLRQNFRLQNNHAFPVSKSHLYIDSQLVRDEKNIENECDNRLHQLVLDLHHQITSLNLKYKEFCLLHQTLDKVNKQAKTAIGQYPDLHELGNIYKV